MSEPVLKCPEWQKSYVTALLEIHPQTLKSKIHVAEVAIQKRVITNNKLDLQERQAISDALSNLRVLNRA